MAKTDQALSLIATRYAAALLDLAEAKKAVSKVQKDLEALSKLLETSADFQTFTASPLVSEAERLSVIETISTKAKFQKLTHNFLGTLVENRRLDTLSAVIAAFHRLFSERSGEVIAEVTTAHKLSAAQSKELVKVLSKEVGSDIILSAKVDKNILGGMIVKIGSRMVDNSVARKLERLGAVLVCQNADDVEAPKVKTKKKTTKKAASKAA